MADFASALRMNNIFPSGGFNPFGAPVDNGINLDEIGNLITRAQGPIQAARQQQQDFQVNQHGQDQATAMRNQMTARAQAAMDVANRPMNTVYAPNLGSGMDPYKSAQLGLKSRDLDIKSMNQQGRDANADADRDIRQQRANTYSGMHDLSDSDKLLQNAENVLKRIAAQGGNAINLQDMKGDQNANLLKTRGEQAVNLQDMKGDQADERIDRTGDQTRQTNAERPVKPESAANQRIQEYLNARKLANNNPELAKFINIGDNGAFDITPPSTGWLGGQSGPTNDQLQMINEAIYGIKPPAVMVNGKPVLFGQYNNSQQYQNGTQDQTQQPNTGQQSPNSKYQMSIK